MDSFTLKQYFLYGVVPLAAITLFLKPGILISIRQKWLVWTVMSHSKKHGHSHDNHGHGHGADVADLKKAVFHKLSTQTISNVPALKDRNSGIRILEIGVGAGANFQYFPSKCTFIAVDPNPQFESYVKENLAKFPGIQMERRLLCGAEDMQEVESCSVDAVVGTGVFCNIDDVKKAFDEIIRILVPGGNFYFMDHVRMEKHTFGRYFFDFLSWTRIAKLIFNATLNRNVNEDIETAGFTAVTKQISEYQGHRVVIGVATK